MSLPAPGTTRVPSIVEFATDRQLLGLALSPAQETLLRAIYGLPLLLSEHRDLWRLSTGRETYPGTPFGEVTVVAGARAGKDSRIAAPVVVYEALFGGHERSLARGEHGVIPLVAQDARATKVAFGYIKDYLMRSPLLAGLVEEPLAQEITLTNGLTIACFPCTLRSLRGWSIPAAVLDEVAFFRLEGQADSDAEVQASVRRGMLGFPAPRLVKISTPYMKSGVLFDDFRRGFGQENPDLLVWRASSAMMNPSLRPERLDRERRLDPSRFAREYEAEFAEDLEAFLPAAWVEGAVMVGRYELPPQAGKAYRAAGDSMGAGTQNPDRFTLTILHSDGAGSEMKIVQDLMRSWGGQRGQSVDLLGVVREIATCLRCYGLDSLEGDNYAAGWVRQAFDRVGVTWRLAEMDKSRAYLEVRPLFAQGRIELLDHPEMIRELKLLERRPRPGGKDLVDHPRGGHDDHANSLAVAAAPLAGNVDGGLWWQRAGGILAIGRGLAPVPPPEPSREEILACEAKCEAEELERQRVLEEREKVEIWHRLGAWTTWR